MNRASILIGWNSVFELFAKAQNICGKGKMLDRTTKKSQAGSH